MLALLRPAFVLLFTFTVLTGIAYPFAITALADLLAPAEAHGSLVMRDGKVVGSALIGQSFATDRYFHGRPSATTAADPNDATKTLDAPYNASASTGSNLGPSSKALKDAVAERAAALGLAPAPADLVTASASGLDPDISPAGALAQIPRVASARGLDPAKVKALVDRHIEPRQWLVFGEPRVNVLALNLALDATQP